MKILFDHFTYIKQDVSNVVKQSDVVTSIAAIENSFAYSKCVCNGKTSAS